MTFFHPQTCKTESRLTSTACRDNKLCYLNQNYACWQLVNSDHIEQQIVACYILYLPCFFGRSTVNLCRTSLVFPQRVPNSAPLPSITMKPNLLSSASRAFKACQGAEHQTKHPLCINSSLVMYTRDGIENRWVGTCLLLSVLLSAILSIYDNLSFLFWFWLEGKRKEKNKKQKHLYLQNAGDFLGCKLKIFREEGRFPRSHNWYLSLISPALSFQ